MMKRSAAGKAGLIARRVCIALTVGLVGAFSAGCQFLPRIAGPASAAPLARFATSLPAGTATAPAHDQPPATPTALVATPVPAETTARQLRVFHDLWDIVNERYIYSDFNGVDWPAARIETEARIRAGLSDDEFHALLRDLVDGLGDEHSKFLSPDEVAEEEQEYAGTGEFVGIGIVTDHNADAERFYVLQVLPGSPAEEAGIKPHDHILKANGAPLMNEAGEPDLAPLRGPEGTTVTVTVRTPGQPARDLVVERRRLSSVEPVEYRLLSEKPRIGYILIPTFFQEGIDEQVRDALRDLMQSAGHAQRLDGLVIDMRINGGGAYPILVSHLGFFTSGTLGYLVDRQGMRLPVRARPERVGNSQTVPLVILIGPATQSYAEVFAGSLRHKGRATLIGQRSGGNVETLHSHFFEDGSMVWLAEETFQLPDGATWEGHGIEPDVMIDRNWDEFTAEDDPAIQAAIRRLSD